MATDVFRRIVVPTDFSACAEEAWRLAQRAAERLGSEMILLHVFVEPPLYGDPPSVAATWKVLVEAEQWVAEELERWADEARKRKITVRTVVRRGSPTAEVVARPVPC